MRLEVWVLANFEHAKEHDRFPQKTPIGVGNCTWCMVKCTSVRGEAWGVHVSLYLR